MDQISNTIFFSFEFKEYFVIINNFYSSLIFQFNHPAFVQCVASLFVSLSFRNIDFTYLNL